MDPVTNEIIPKAAKGKRNRTPVGIISSEDGGQQPKVPEYINATELREQMEILLNKQAELKKEVSDMDTLINKLYSLVHEVGTSV